MKPIFLEGHICFNMKLMKDPIKKNKKIWIFLPQRAV